MKILWFSHIVPYPPKGGALQRNFNLIAQLASEHRVWLLTFNQRALIPSAPALDAAIAGLKPYCEQVSVLPLPGDHSAPAKASLIVKSAFTSAPYAVNWSRSAAMERLFRETVQSFRPDLIHYDAIGLAHYHHRSIPACQVLNHQNIESAMMLRRSEQEPNLLKKLYFRGEAEKIRRYERLHCPRFDLNVTVSDVDTATLEATVPGVKAEVIPNGVDISYFTPGPAGEEEEGSLVFAGGMGWYPNRDAMLYFADQLWPMLKRSEPNVRMTVVGRRPPARLVELSRRDPNFSVPGYVDDVRPYLKRASVYVCPIRDGGGTRLKLLDAMAMGKPIVATSIAIEGTDSVPGRHVLVGDRPEEFVSRVVTALRDPALRRTLSRQARSLVEEEYDWTHIGKKINGLYGRLAASHRPAAPERHEAR